MAPTSHQDNLVILSSDDENDRTAALQQMLSKELARASRHFQQSPIFLKPVSSPMNHRNKSTGKTKNKDKFAVEISDSIPDDNNDKLKFSVIDRSGLNCLKEHHRDFMSSITQNPKPMFRRIFKRCYFDKATLSSLLCTLISYCRPTRKPYKLGSEAQPHWWPMMKASWWTELGFPRDKGEPPYACPHDLKKRWKLAVLASAIKHLSPESVCSIVRLSDKLQNMMTVHEKYILSVTLGYFDGPNTSTPNCLRTLTTVKIEDIIGNDGDHEPNNARMMAREEYSNQFADYSSSFAGQLNQNFVGSIRNSTRNMPVLSNGFNTKSSDNWATSNNGKQCYSLSANDCGIDCRATSNKLILTKMEGRNGLVLAMPGVERSRSLPEEKAATLDQAPQQFPSSTSANSVRTGSEMVTGKLLDRSRSPFFQSNEKQEGNQLVNGSSSGSSKDLRGQGSLTAPTQPSLLSTERNYLGLPEKMTVTANQDSQINVNSSTGLEAGSRTLSMPTMNQRKIFNGYNQESIPSLNQDSQTLASDTTPPCNMSQGWSHGYMTESALSASMHNKGNLSLPQETAPSNRTSQWPPMIAGTLCSLPVSDQYNELDTVISNQDLWTVVYGGSAPKRNRGLNPPVLSASGPAGEQVNHVQPSFFPHRTSPSEGRHFYEKHNNLLTKNENQKLQEVVNSNTAVSSMTRQKGNPSVSGLPGPYKVQLQPSVTLTNYSPPISPSTPNTSTAPVRHQHIQLTAGSAFNMKCRVNQGSLATSVSAGQQGRQGQASLFPANYNQVLVIVDDTVHNGTRGMNNGLLTTSAQSVVANHSLQQEAVMKPGSSMSESNKNYADLSEIEDILSYFG